MLPLHAGLLMTVVAVCIQGSRTQCTDGDVMLVGGPASNEGVVEVCINSNWGNICADDDWGRNDATVICRQLGYPHDYYYGLAIRRFSRQENTVLSDVKCNPFGEHLLYDCTFDVTNECSDRRIAYVVCRDDKRVKNISINLITTASANVHMVSVTWVQNASAAEPTSFEVKCQDDFNTITVIVNNKTNTTELIGLLPSSSYNCCVSGLYRAYVARDRCTPNFTTPEMTSSDSVTLNVVGGVLGFIVVLLLVLLIISVVALVCVLRPSARLKNSALYGRLSRLSVTRSTTIPVSNNVSYLTQPPTSRPQPQAVRLANPTAAQLEASATAPNYSSVGPAYESIESRRQVQLEGSANRVNMRERYEFAEIHAETDGQNGVQESMDYEVPVPSVSQTEDYSRLQH